MSQEAELATQIDKNDVELQTSETAAESSKRGVRDAAESTFMVDEDDKTVIDTNNRDKIREGIYHMILVATIALICIPLAHRTDLSPENIAGWALLLVYTTYLGHIWWLYITCENMYRIYTFSGVPHDWINMSVAFKNRKYKDEPITSISEFSAIAGGVGKMLLARVGTITWGILMTLITVQIANDAIKVRPSLLLQCVGAFGIDMIGTFYDDPYSIGMKTGHYTGVGGAICCLVGFWIQRVKYGHIWIPIVMTVLFALFFFLFQCYDKISPMPDKPTRKQITRRSQYIILFETIGLGMLSYSMCFYFIMYPVVDE